MDRTIGVGHDIILIIEVIMDIITEGVTDMGNNLIITVEEIL